MTTLTHPETETPQPTVPPQVGLPYSSASQVARPLEWSFPEAVGPFTLVGYSRARERTSFVIPELGLVLDGGLMAHPQRSDAIFVTHTHTDHVHMLTHLRSRHKPPEIHVPAHAVGLLNAFFDAAQALTDNAPLDPTFERQVACHIVPRTAGDLVRVGRKGRKLNVRTIATTHSVPSLGYLFFEVRNKLKDEYVGLEPKAIGALRKEGVEITREHERPLFAYLGDTTAKVFEDHPEVLRMPVVITECTFLLEEHHDAAVRTFHTVWDDLVPIVDANPETTFVLGHLSWRYTPSDLRKLTAERHRANVVWWTAAG